MDIVAFGLTKWEKKRVRMICEWHGIIVPIVDKYGMVVNTHAGPNKSMKTTAVLQVYAGYGPLCVWDARNQC